MVDQDNQFLFNYKNECIHKLLFIDDGLISCPKCKTTMDSIEDVYFCPKCSYFIGMCPECESFSDCLMYWGTNEILNFHKSAISYLPTFKDKQLLKWWCHEYYFLYNPPFIVADKSKGIYVDDSTIWIYYCPKCRRHRLGECG